MKDVLIIINTAFEGRNEVMDFVIAGIISIFVGGYLVFTLLYPERF